MTDSTWKKTLRLLEENQTLLENMKPSDPVPTVRFWRESAHRTLGHLTACQAAWLPLMQALRDGEPRAAVPINPDPLYRNLGFAAAPWCTILERFKSGRNEWRRLLSQVDLNHELQTPRRTCSAQTLTKRMVDHEKHHLEDL